MKSQSTKRPKVFETIGYGRIVYRFDIAEKEIPATEEKEASIIFEFSEVYIAESDDRDALTKAVIADYCSPERELKMINESLATGKFKPTEEYEVYQAERTRRIAMAKKDWEDHRYA